jgi:integrase
MGLTNRKIAALTKDGRYADGHGLVLQVRGNSKSWLLRFQRNGRERWLGLGPLHVFTLEQARQRAREAQQQLYRGIDPIEEKRRVRAAARLAEARTLTFAQACEQYLASHGEAWSRKWCAMFKQTMEQYVHPTIGKLAVADVDVAFVLRVLEPIWLTMPPTADRVRRRIEGVLNWAEARGFRTGDNPAEWKRLKQILPAPHKLQKVAHHSALAVDAVPAFMADLRTRSEVAARAVELTILTAARHAEVARATWGEFDLAKGLWVVPAERMKAGKPHRVPLSTRAVELLRGLPREDGHGPNSYVFFSIKGTHLSDKAMRRVLERMGHTGLSMHGFRSSFRDFAAEKTTFPREVAELSLAHSVGSQVEKAYFRSDLLEQRRKLLEVWSGYCTSSPAENIVVMARRRGKLVDKQQ